MQWRISFTLLCTASLSIAINLQYNNNNNNNNLNCRDYLEPMYINRRRPKQAVQAGQCARCSSSLALLSGKALRAHAAEASH